MNLTPALPPATRARLLRYGSWAVVTGASSGIGRAAALRLAEAGISVVLVARNAIVLEEVARMCRSSGVDALVVAADLGTAQGTDAVNRACAGLDVGIFVGAAGFGTSGRFLDAAIEEEREMLAVNCEAVLEQTHAFARRFKERGRGGIVLLASLVGWNGTPNAASYAATKAYVQTLAEGIAPELARHRVDVLSAAPGPVASGFAARADMKMAKAADADETAVAILKALGRRRTVVPGRLSKLLTYSLAMLPRPARIRIIGSVMEGMTRHQHDQTRPAPRPS